MPAIRSLLAATKKADETFALFDPGDVIAIGVSGGKDSMALLYALHLYGMFSKKDFKIVPICLDLGFPGFDMSQIQAYCEELGHPLNLIDAKEVYPILLQHTKPGHHIPCSICSRMKKAAMNDAAKKLGCNKVAFAHHRDDALETLLMNMIHGGAVATFEPKMRLDRAGITFIRPFIFVEEDVIRLMIEEEGIPTIGKTCPADGYTERQYCKDLLNSLYQQRPEAKTNFSSMLFNVDSFRLYFDHLEYPNPANAHLTLRPLISARETLDYWGFASKHNLEPLSKDALHFLVKKDHQLVGSISYAFPYPHECHILGVDLPLLSEEEAVAVLTHFEGRMIHDINPILFVWNEKSPPLTEGYALGIPPRGEHYSKRISR